MNNLYILTKQEFTSLYRFGKTPLVLSKVINPLNKNSSEIDELIFNAFIDLPFFVGDEEYLIISFDSNTLNENWLEIENVSEVIPLTKAAKNSIQMKFDTRLNFKEARFEHVIHKIEEYIDLQERYSGAKAFWNICHMKTGTPFENLVQNNLITEAYYNKIQGRKSSEIQSDFLVHLLSYDRYEFFPNSDLGYFYDIGEIFAHSKGKKTFVGSSFYSFLENNKQELSMLEFLQIAKIISESESIVKFTEQLTTENIKLHIASALFLKFKSDLSDRETIKGSETGKLISEIRRLNSYIGELNLAIYLSGAFFGYQKFYDDLYDLVDLKIFKEKTKVTPRENKFKIVTPIPNEVQEVSISENETRSIEEKEDYEEITNNDLNTIINNELNNDQDSSETKIANLNNSIIEEPIETDQFELLKNQEKPNEQIITNDQSSSIEQTEITKELSIGERTILDIIIKNIDEGKGVFELKSDRLNEIKNAISISIPDKNNLKKDDIIQFIKQTFESSIKIESKGNKWLVSKKFEGSLFNGY